jgi:hypothetical protein
LVLVFDTVAGFGLPAFIAAGAFFSAAGAPGLRMGLPGAVRLSSLGLIRF